MTDTCIVCLCENREENYDHVLYGLSYTTHLIGSGRADDALVVYLI